MRKGLTSPHLKVMIPSIVQTNKIERGIEMDKIQQFTIRNPKENKLCSSPVSVIILLEP